MAPGILVQMITTKQPTDDQIEVAIVSMEQALEADGETVPDGLGAPGARAPRAGSGDRRRVRRLGRDRAGGAPMTTSTSLDAKLDEVARQYDADHGGAVAARRRRATPTRSGGSAASGLASNQPSRPTGGSRRPARSSTGAHELRDTEADDEMRQMAQAEIERLVGEEAGLLDELKVLLLPRDPADDGNVILEIRAGTGGEEAALFAGELLRMYLALRGRHRYKAEVMSLNETGIGGVKEAIVEIAGDGAYSRLKFESGTHRVQRVPATESSGRIHTSTATVVVHARGRGGRDRDRRGARPPDRRQARIGPGWPVGQHHGLGGASDPPADRHWWSRSRTRRASTRTRPRRSRSCAPACSRPSASASARRTRWRASR